MTKYNTYIVCKTITIFESLFPPQSRQWLHLHGVCSCSTLSLSFFQTHVLVPFPDYKYTWQRKPTDLTNYAWLRNQVPQQWFFCQRSYFPVTQVLEMNENVVIFWHVHRQLYLILPVDCISRSRHPFLQQLGKYRSEDYGWGCTAVTIQSVFYLNTYILHLGVRWL